jgi:hypothetical protein
MKEMERKETNLLKRLLISTRIFNANSYQQFAIRIRIS